MSRKVKRRDSKAGTILYLMVHFPYLWWWKIGITGRTATARAKDIDEAMFGFPVPVLIVWVPGAYIVEQWLHSVCRGMRADFYSGDGHSEWFWVPAILFALPVMLAIWGLYFYLVSLCMEWDAFEWYLNLLFVLVQWGAQGLKFLLAPQQ